MMRRLMALACGAALVALTPVPVLAEHGDDEQGSAVTGADGASPTTTIVVTIPVSSDTEASSPEGSPPPAPDPPARLAVQRPAA